MASLESLAWAAIPKPVVGSSHPIVARLIPSKLAGQAQQRQSKASTCVIQGGLFGNECSPLTARPRNAQCPRNADKRNESQDSRGDHRGTPTVLPVVIDRDYDTLS